MHSSLLEKGPGFLTSVVACSVNYVAHPLHLVRVVGSDELVKVVHEYNKYLRIRICLRAGIVYSPIGINPTDDVHPWHQLFNGNSIGLIPASPLESSEAHV